MNQSLFTLILIFTYYILAFLYERKRSKSDIHINASPSIEYPNTREEKNTITYREEVSNIQNGLSINNMKSMSFGNTKATSEKIKIMDFEDFNTSEERHAYLMNINNTYGLNIERDRIDLATNIPIEFSEIVSEIV